MSNGFNHITANSPTTSESFSETSKVLRTHRMTDSRDPVASGMLTKYVCNKRSTYVYIYIYYGCICICIFGQHPLKCVMGAGAVDAVRIGEADLRHHWPGRRALPCDPAGSFGNGPRGGQCHSAELSGPGGDVGCRLWKAPSRKPGGLTGRQTDDIDNRRFLGGARSYLGGAVSGGLFASCFPMISLDTV